MFKLLKPSVGFVLTFDNGHTVEVDFGPMSESEKKNASKKECEMNSASGDAEVRHYGPRGERIQRYENVKTNEFANFINEVSRAG